MMMIQNDSFIEIQDCPICLSTLNNQIQFQCKHQFCRWCVQQYLNLKIDNGIIQQIHCPQCQYIISYDELIQNIDEKGKEKYSRFLLMYYNEKNPSLRHCPNKDCELYVNLDKHRCECGTEICLNCGNISHGLTGCQDLMDSIFVMDSREKKIQRCPKCKIIVQKEGGCNHMTCKRCQYEFCWICRRPYKTTHYDSYNYFFGCPNKRFSEDLPWKYPLFNKILPFILVVSLFPFIIIFGLMLMILQPFSAAFYLFNRSDKGAIKNLSLIQKAFIYFFVYFLGGILLYPFAVVFEILTSIIYVFFMVAKLIWCIIQRIRDN